MMQLVADFQEMFAEQVQYRELLHQMTRRDLLLRYKQTAMGFAWAFLMPLVNTAVFWTIFTRVAPISTTVPYAVFAYCGLLAWNFSASAWRFSVTSLTANATLVTKVYFPREVFPLSAVLVSLVDFGVGALLLFALMAYYHIAVSASMLFLPVVLAVHIAFTLAIGLMLAIANLYFRDVKYLFEVVITIWMFATSVVYPVELVGGRMGAVLRLNPMTPIIDAYRSVLLHGSLPAFGPFATATALALVVLAVSWVTFHRAEFNFAENI